MEEVAKEVTSQTLNAAFTGNPVAIVLLFVVSIVGTLAGTAFIVDKFWYHKERRKNPVRFEPATKKDLIELHKAHTKDFDHLRSTQHEISKTLEQVCSVQEKEVAVSQKQGGRLVSIEGKVISIDAEQRKLQDNSITMLAQLDELLRKS